MNKVCWLQSGMAKHCTEISKIAITSQVTAKSSLVKLKFY